MAEILGGLARLAGIRKEALRAKPKEGAGGLERKRIEAAKVPFEMAGDSPLKPVEVISSRKLDIPRGQALDLNALGDWDLAHFKPLERKRPTTVSNRAKTAYTNENVREFERYVRKGATEGGLEWYDMSPLSRPALQEMSPEDFRSLMAMNAASSARSGVDDQIKRASLAWYYKKQGIPWPMTNEELAKVADPGYGHLAHDIHSKHLAPLVRGEAPNFSSIEQPKYASYHEDFMGNMAPLTADTHYQALHGFPMKETYNKYNKKWIEAPDFSKDVDYPFAENFSGERARRMGMPLPLYQASAWVGGRGATGVRDARPFAAVYDDLIARTAQQLDITPTEAMIKHFRGEIPLMPIERAEGGPVEMAKGGSLLDYIKSRLPREYASQPMRRLQSMRIPKDGLTEEQAAEQYIGSARDIYQLGDDKLVKLAKRPRGLYEQSLEGLPSVERHLPKLHWRSDDNELAIVERLGHTPDASESAMGPLKERYNRAATGDNWARVHRTDRKMRDLMGDAGLEEFFPFNLHGPDFFTVPQAHWSMARGNPRLLDPGAMDHRISSMDYERNYAWPFRDVLASRLQSMTPAHLRTTPEDLMGHTDPRILERYGVANGTQRFLGPNASYKPMKPAELMNSGELADEMAPLLRRMAPTTKMEDQTTFGFAEGGSVDMRIKRLRKHLAGGGTVRNWLRGVKGSAIDEALERLKSQTGPNFNRDRQAMERIVDGDRNAQLDAIKKSEALTKWIDTNLANYIVKQHGTDNDPLIKHTTNAQGRLEAILPHPAAVRKIEAAEVPNEVSSRPLAEDKKKWRDLTMNRIRQENPWLAKLIEQDEPRHWSQRQYSDALGSEEFNRVALKGNQGDPFAAAKAKEMETEAREKYMRRSAPKIELHDLEPSTWRRHYEPEMRNTLDYLSANVDPKDLFRVSVPDAVRKSKEWHAAMAKKAEEAAAVKLEGPGYKQYPSGWKWIEMGGPAERQTGPSWEKTDASHPDNALAQQIGKQLGHCYQDPDTCEHYLSNGKLYSLLDPNGKAHATVEVNPTKGKEKDHFQEMYNEPAIEQIRGPQNGKVVGEALPYVHDFIRSGKWGEIAEPENAGFSRLGMDDKLRAKLEEMYPGSRGLHTEDEIKEGMKSIGRVFGVPTEYAKGGAVAPMLTQAEFPKESPDERLMRAEFQLEVLIDEAQQPGNSPEDAAAIGREIARVEALIARLKLGSTKGLAASNLSTPSRTSAAAPAETAPAAEYDYNNDDAHEEGLDMLERLLGSDSEHHDMLDELLAQAS